MSLTTSGHSYRFQRLAMSLVMSDMRFTAGEPRPGDRAPAFDMPAVGGGRVALPDPSEPRNTLLVFGSSTCPATDRAMPGLLSLHRRFGEAVRFVLVNVREAHPGEAFPQPTTGEAKLEHACWLQQTYDVPFAVAVDDIEGSLHRALGPKPNSAYLLAPDGTILFRAHWASDTPSLDRALAEVTASRALTRRQSGGLLRAMLRMLGNIAPVLDRAGRGAWADMWRVAPPLTALAWLLKLLRVGPRRPSASREPRLG